DFNTSVTELYQLNELDSEQIFPGQVLKVEEEEIIHLIERGDTLYALANHYEVRVLDLMNWNDLTSDLIITGNELVIYPTAEAVEADQEEAAKTVQAVINEAPEEPAKKASSENQTLTMTATAYTAECDGCSGITYTGLD